MADIRRRIRFSRESVCSRMEENCHNNEHEKAKRHNGSNYSKYEGQDSIIIRNVAIGPSVDCRAPERKMKTCKIMFNNMHLHVHNYQF